MHNIRFPEIWQILTRHIDFENKSLLDVGSGYGDLMKAAHKKGAKVYGIDKNIQLVEQLKEFEKDDFYISFVDIDKVTEGDFLLDDVDILTCFSVLPYLNKPNQALRYFKKLAKIVVIECQYANDGPGFYWLKGDGDMEAWLKQVWNTVGKIGETKVEDRDKQRSIWLCE